MFNNSSKPDSSYEEGIVTEVDSIRKLCKVKTLSGQNLTEVQWLDHNSGATRSGDRSTPVLGQKVVIFSGLGYPVIWGTLSKLQSDQNIFPMKIDTGMNLVDTGNFSGAGKTVVGDQYAPGDMVVGDRVLGSLGGGILALLRGGSVLIRSSRLAEIYLSKWNDLVRIVSRNYEHFTDVSSDVIRNLNGRVYRYTGYAHLAKDAKIELYQYHTYHGDVTAAESVKTDYENVTPAAQTDVVFKEQITGGGSSELLRREIHLDGTHDLVVLAGGVFTRIKSTNGEVVITYKDVNVIKVNNDEISLRKGGDPISVVLTDSSIKSTFGGAVQTMDSSGVTTTFGGKAYSLTSGGFSVTG